MVKQTQCNVVNPCTGQPYTMEELVSELRRCETMLERVGGGSLQSPARGGARRQGGARPGSERGSVWEGGGPLAFLQEREVW
jgi:hypothetical protein